MCVHCMYMHTYEHMTYAICKHVLVTRVLFNKISVYLVLPPSQDISPKVCAKWIFLIRKCNSPHVWTSSPSSPNTCPGSA